MMTFREYLLKESGKLTEKKFVADSPRPAIKIQQLKMKLKHEDDKKVQQTLKLEIEALEKELNN